MLYITAVVELSRPMQTVLTRVGLDEAGTGRGSLAKKW